MSRAYDERAPVIVGFGELVRRPAQGAEASEPAAMMADALRLAARDAGVESLLARADAIACPPSIAWLDGDPARRVAELLGSDARTLRSSMQGGNGPQLIVNVLAARIQAGALDIALVCGAEALQSVVHAAKTGLDLGWPVPDSARAPGEVLDDDRAPNTGPEGEVGVIAPVTAYPLIENAIRGASGATVAEHQRRVAKLWASFSEVAATQECAWTPTAMTAEQLATPGSRNRPVTFPYLKLMNANIQVDQAAALVLCSARAAAAAGVPRDRWVFVHAGAHASDEWFLSHRRALDRSPAIAACGRAVLGHADAAIDEIEHVDLYSCFPAAVQLAAGELGLALDDPARPLTCTGGLTFFGGPGNNYSTHGIGAVVRRLRESGPGSLGLVSALGWYATKHALGVYGSSPPARAYACFEPQAEVDQAASPREVAEPARLEATAETCTVVYERDGAPSYGALFALLDDGRRALGKTDDPGLLATMTGDGFLGSRVELLEDRTFAPV